MLILTRRTNETLMVGDDVTVTVLGVKGNQVRIGVNAPREIAVHREEIYDRIRAENLQKNVVKAIFRHILVLGDHQQDLVSGEAGGKL